MRLGRVFSSLNSINRREYVIVGLIAIVFSVLFYRATRSNYYVLQLDTAYLLELVDSTFEKGIPTTYLGKSFLVALNTLFTAAPERVCSFAFGGDSGPPLNNFERHSYAILYLLAGLRFALSSAQIAFLFQVLAFPAFLLAVYLVARREGLAPLKAAALALLSAAHPAWSYAAFGQFYVDKYFVPLGFLAAYLVYRRLARAERRTFLLIGLWILAAATSERSAIMLGAFTLGALVLWRGGRGSSWRPDALLLALAVVSLAYAAIYMGWQQKNPDYASYTSGALHWLSRRAYLEPALWTFLFVNTALFGILAIPEWRIAVLALGAMLPNILGNIGGAEKLGWTAHYHAMYFPFLVLAVLLGYARIDAWCGRRTLSAILPCVLIPVLLCLNPFTPAPLFDLSPRNVRESAILKTLEFNTGTAAMLATSEWNRRLAASVPAGSDVTTPEGGVTTLYGSRRRLHYYPLALDVAEYAVLSYAVRAGGGRQYLGAVSYLGPKAADAINECLSGRVAAQYEVVAEFPAISAVVLRRRHLPPPGTASPASAVR